MTTYKQGIITANGTVEFPSTAQIWMQSDATGNTANVSSTGTTSGFVGTASFTPAASAYSANADMDVAKEFVLTYAGANTAVPAGSLVRVLSVILEIGETALQSSEGAYTLQCFNVTPPSALADKSVWTLGSSDIPAYQGMINLGTPVDLGSACFIKTPGIDFDAQLVTSSLWCQIQTVAAFTPTAVPRTVYLYGIVL